MVDVQVHRCSLPHRNDSNLKKLPPNASWCMRLRRGFRKLIIVNPKNFRCKIFFSNKSMILTEQRRHINSPYYYVIHPYSTLSSAYEVAFLITWMVKMITDPILEITDPVNYVLKVIVDLVLPVIQYVLIFSLFFVGYIDVEAREIVIEPKRVIKKYLKTFFIVDLLAADGLEYVVLLPFQIFKVVPNWRFMKVIQYLHVFFLYARVNTILAYMNDVLHMFKVSRKIRKSLGYCLKTYVYLHLFSTLVYFVPMVVYYQKWPVDSWIVVAKLDPAQNPSIQTIYRECFLMTMCFFFGTSSGKYNVNQTNEQICFCLITLFGRMYTLFLVADALRMFGVVGVSESSYERNLVQLNEYMKANDLPFTMRNRMVRYYEHKLQKRYFNEEEILNSLSDNLRNELFLYSARMLIEKSQIFKYLPQRETATLISLMKTETFAPGNVVLRTDNYNEYVYFISTGSVAIFNNTGIELCHYGDGDAFGFISKILNKNNYTVLILETTELFTIRLKELNEFLEPYPEAMTFLNEMIKVRLAEYKLLADTKMNTGNCLVELRTGRLLERRKERGIFQE
ncbi:potassium/sodium hyperpolarization-activated cyclic nucleotide-gated channel 1-like [Anoplophora glabripennis]|uniref:potassium/sodium hyperpolarization-activated cyclic nucleotide-gated channel 1-like n=1 Tax=Anoplophora glabripennis TaxID=217634 RepID=UPI000874A614|nr:potassium/sodium hyperpolarization-activated cyclic nucleotide-gated channel 1-like [Anoplophora glabripennis]